MTSFDALRASHVGAVSYLCKPRPPEELLGCWNLATNYSDLSRYGNSINGPAANLYESQYMNEPFKRSFGYSEREPAGYVPLSLPLAKSINFEEPWSVDWFGFFENVSGFRLIIGNFNISWSNAWGQHSSYPVGFNFDGTNILSFVPPESSYKHHAICYTGTTLKFYLDGSLSKSVTASLSGTSNSILLNADNARYSGSHVSNLRIIQKNLGTSSYYPVPSGLYTGFETL